MSYSDEILPAPMKVITTHNTDDERIVLYLQGRLKRTELSPKMEEKLQRMKQCAELIKEHGSRLKVVPILINVFDVSESTAINIFNSTQRIFGVTTAHTQQFWFDIVLGEVMANMRAARAAQDWKAVASFTRQMLQAVEQLGTGDAALYERIQPILPEIGFFPEELKTKLPPPEQLRKEIDKLRRKMIQKVASDVEYE